MLQTVVVPAREAWSASVIWLHGLGADGHDFEPLAPLLGMPWVRFVFPHAPRRPVTINGGMIQRSWYDIRHLDFQRPDREDPVQVQDSARQVAELVAAEERALPSQRVLVAGFSQGGAMALQVGLTYPRPLAGILALSCYLLAETRPEPANASTPVLVMHGRYDQVVPAFAGQLTYQAVRAGREAAYRDYPMGHEVCSPQVADIAAWLKGRLPPTSG